MIAQSSIYLLAFDFSLEFSLLPSIYKGWYYYNNNVNLVDIYKI